MTDRTHGVFVGPRTQTHVVDIEDLFTFLDLVIEVYGIGMSAKEGVTWIHRWYEGQFVHKRFDLWILLFETRPLTAPDGDNLNVTITNSLEMSHGVAIHGVHTTIVETTIRFLSIVETRRTPVPKAAQVLVSGVGRLVVAVHGPTGARDLIFAQVAGMTDTWLSGLLCLQLMFLPLQPFHGFLGMIGDQTPATERFGSDGVFLRAVKTEIVHAHTGCGYFFKGLKCVSPLMILSNAIHPTRKSLTSDIQ